MAASGAGGAEGGGGQAGRGGGGAGGLGAAAGDLGRRQQLGLYRAWLVHQDGCGLFAGNRVRLRGTAACGAVVAPDGERFPGQPGGVQAGEVPGDDDRGGGGPYLRVVEAGDHGRGELRDGGEGALGGPPGAGLVAVHGGGQFLQDTG